MAETLRQRRKRPRNIERLQKRFDILSEFDGSYYRNNIPTSVTVRNKICDHTFTSTAKNLLARNVNCPTCNKANKRAKFQQFNIERYKKFQETASDWQAYKHRVYMMTRSTYRKHHSLINPTNLPQGLAGTPGAYHLDHRVPVRYCFEHYISAEICAHKDNLQMLPWLDNIRKR